MKRQLTAVFRSEGLGVDIKYTSTVILTVVEVVFTLGDKVCGAENQTRQS